MTVDKYAQARRNMVDGQLKPNSIRDERILDVFGAVPRERFLPEAKQGVAYIDEDIKLDSRGNFMPEPLILARMIQALAPQDSDNVLNIGDMTGYSSAILSRLVSTVVTVEETPGQLDQARQVWEEYIYCNIAIITGEMTAGCPEHAPYDLICLNGAVPEIPQGLLSQLTERGRLVTVLKEPGHPGTGQIVLVQKIGDQFARRTLFDAAIPYIPQFAPQPRFCFA